MTISHNWPRVNRRKRCLRLVREVLGTVLRESVNHLSGGVRSGRRTVKDDFFCLEMLAVNSTVGIVIGAQGGTIERDTREQPSRSRVGENLSAEGDVGSCFCVASDRTRGGRSVGAEFHLAV